ncbi:MAG: hypothetical protein Q7S68_01370 [Deltaproteobacteria bacterium]|nr:hypothetical protein [Deltaproteobacteria bacterium]
MKKLLLAAILLFAGVASLLIGSEARACGHEGFYTGLGYSQLFQYTPDKQLAVSTVGSTSRVDWNSRFGGYVKFGYDFCASRWGVEVPLNVDQQRLNQQELVYVMTGDANAIFHIAETRKGLDFYWIGGLGGNYVTEGIIKDKSRAIGVNLNFGPGFQYFIKRGEQKIGIGLSIPARATLYFGNNLSKNKTAVFAVPFRVGLTVGF